MTSSSHLLDTEGRRRNTYILYMPLSTSPVTIRERSIARLKEGVLPCASSAGKVTGAHLTIKNVSGIISDYSFFLLR